MPSFAAVETTERLAATAPALLELSAFDRMCIHHLVGHKITRIERELILQTLKCNQGNRTLSADVLGISVRSLRQKIASIRIGAKLYRTRNPTQLPGGHHLPTTCCLGQTDEH